MICMSIAAKAQDEFLNDLINLWNNKKFDKVYLPLKEYKDSKKISGDFEIDYMIASSASRSGVNVNEVKAMFDDLSKNYTFKTADEEYVQQQAMPERYQRGKNQRMDDEYIANRGKAGDKSNNAVPHPLGKIELQKIEASKVAEQKKIELAKANEQKKKELAELALKKKQEAEAKKAMAKMKADSIAAAKLKAIAPTSTDSAAVKTETDELKDYNDGSKDLADKKKAVDTKTATTTKKVDAKTVATTIDVKKAGTTSKDKILTGKDKMEAKNMVNGDDVVKKIPGVTQIVKGDKVIKVKPGFTYIVRTDSIFEMPPPTPRKPIGTVANPQGKK